MVAHWSALQALFRAVAQALYREWQVTGADAQSTGEAEGIVGQMVGASC